MIHVRAMQGYNDTECNMSEPPTLQFTITTEADIQKFKEVLQRALNCSPEFGTDWFELDARVDQFLRQIQKP